MTAATQALERKRADNAKKKAQIADLQQFVSRFSANASKSKQATSRAKQIDKIKLEDIKPSSRQNPYIVFEQDKKLFRNAVEVKSLAKSFDDEELFSSLDLRVEVGERIAIIGPNGVGKTTLLRCLMGDLEPSAGEVKWSENATLGYYAQDHAADFEDKLNLFDWMQQWGKESDDEQIIRGTLGRLLFSSSEINKNRERDLRRRAGPHAVRQDHAAAPQHHAAGRTHQPPGHGIHRVAQPGVGKLPGHAAVRQPRP
jgi:ATPase subunit of ABC transporter with duplicated ATPase domains